MEHEIKEMEMMDSIEGTPANPQRSIRLVNIDDTTGFTITADIDKLGQIIHTMQKVCQNFLGELPEAFINLETTLPEIHLEKDQIKKIIGGLKSIPEEARDLAENSIFQALETVLAEDE